MGSALARKGNRAERENQRVGVDTGADPWHPKPYGSLPEPVPHKIWPLGEAEGGDSEGVATGHVDVEVTQSGGRDAGPQVPPDVALHPRLLPVRTHPTQLLCPTPSHSHVSQFTFFFSPQVSASFRPMQVGLDLAISLPTSQRPPHLCPFPSLSTPPPDD